MVEEKGVDAQRHRGVGDVRTSNEEDLVALECSAGLQEEVSTSVAYVM